MFATAKIQGLIFFLLFFLAPARPPFAFAQQSGVGIVISDSELATKAGMEILKRGGNAMDAAVATAFALGVVDPASSGVGGGGFMVVYQAKEKKAHVLDFRETAPAAAHKTLFIKDGKFVKEIKSTTGKDWDDLKNIGVSDDEKKMFVLSGSKVYEVSL